MASEPLSSPLSPAMSIATLPESPHASEETVPMPSTRRYRARLSTAEKIKKASDFLRTELNLSPAEYIKLLFSQTDNGSRVRQKHFFEVAYTSPEILQYLAAHPTTRIEALNALEWGIPDLRKEMARLTASELFGEYRTSDKSITSVDNEALSATMSDNAPHILHLLHAISEPARSVGSPSRSGRMVMVLAILCYSFRPRGGTNIPSLIGLYLHSKGVKRVVIELLHRFGITVSYDAIMSNVRTLSKDSADAVALAGQASNAVTVYDNFEQMEGVREQRIEDNSSFHSVTAAKVFGGLEIPSGGLDQDMLNPQAALNIQQVLFAPGNRSDEVRQQVSLYFILRALHTAFPEAIGKLRHLEPLSRLTMPKVDVLKPQMTVHHPLNLIPHDESSNAGNLAVLDNIFRRQYHRDEVSFVNQLSLVYGDQKTIQRIRTIKRRRQHSIGSYDSLRWILPVPAFFHLKMNYLYMISRSHFGGSGSDQSTLCHAMNFWQRKKISREHADFFALEELVIHSYQARICAIFWRLLGLGRDTATIRGIVESLDSSAVTELIRETLRFIDTNRHTSDDELRNHIRFLELAEVYQLLKYAIKHGDIGLIRRVIDRCCIFFHGSGQHKYAYEMLYLQRLLSTSAATPTLQRAILSNSLVNFKGLPDSWLETDRMIELHNGDMKKIFRARRGSSLNVERLFEYSSLNSTYFVLLQRKLERAFGVTRMKGTHTAKSAQQDVLAMAGQLATCSVDCIPNRQSNYIAPDLLNEGAYRIANEALCKFNNQHQLVEENDDDNESENSPTGFFTDGPAEGYYFF